MGCSWKGWAAGLLCAALQVSAAAEEPVPAGEPAAAVEAVWVERKVNFTYMPLTSYYSCDGLRDKLRWILRELGARPGFRVVSRGCIEVQGPEPFPGVEIVAAFPEQATPELLERLAAEASTRQLAARAAGKPDPVAEATTRFPARARRVEFTSTSGTIGNLQDGDCELIEQMLRNRVFEKLGARVIDAQVHCVPRQVTLGAVRMTLQVLEPVAEQ